MFNLMWQPGSTLDSLEKEAILHAFRFFRGNKTATARSLDISIRTLDEKLKKYETEGKDKKDAEFERRQKDKEFQLRQRGIDPVTGRNLLDTTFEPGVASATAKSESKDANDEGAISGARVEPASQAPAKQPLPVSERQKVQGVPSKQHASVPSAKAGR